VGLCHGTFVLGSGGQGRKSMAAIAGVAPSAQPDGVDVQDRNWRMAGLTLLSVRFVQGWIYWGGGSRRFIYAPQKLVPHGHWMADKLQSAMPGALLGTGRIIAFLLHHFVLLYASLVVFSAAELVCGLMLIAGLLTRLAAAASVLFSLVLMLTFGWQGATCIDEWTMAASNTAMGVTLALAGAGAWSFDNALLRRFPALAGRAWFRWFGGSLPLPIPERAFRSFALILFGVTAAFTVGTYSYYRGSVVTSYHHGPVSPTVHHMALTHGRWRADGSVRFHAYVDGGTAAVPSHIAEIALLDTNGSVLEHWDARTLASLPTSAFHNDFSYGTFKAGPFGITAPVGAAATITLPLTGQARPQNGAELQITTVDDKSFRLAVTAAPGKDNP
jgi:uncharacterized membrane protein YphA (DoxX/SURF4 family)